MKTPTWIAAALLAPLAAAQQAAPKPIVAPAAVPAPAAYDSLAALVSAASGSFGSAQRAACASIAPRMRLLAAAGDGRAVAWCLRHPEALPPGEDRALCAAVGFAALVRDHAGAAWLRAPELDPVTALERADAATRQAVASALAAEFAPDDGARQLALLLEAAALAPTHARESARAAQALERLDELRSAWPDGPWTARATALAWRIEHLSPGRTAPELALRDVDGNELVLQDWRGGDVLIDVWRSDDSDRGEHASELAALLGRVRALRPELGLRVLGLGLGGEELAFRHELEELELPWPTAFEPEGLGPAQAAWKLDGRPTTLWIDAAGVVRVRGGSLIELEGHLLAPSEPAPIERAEPLDIAPDDQTSDAAAPSGRRESQS